MKGKYSVKDIASIDGKIKGLRHQRKECRAHLGQRYRHNNKGWLVTLDVLMVLCFVFNFGALVTTNLLVTKDHIENTGVTPEYVEANPVTASMHNYKTAEQKEERQSMNRFIAGLGLASLVWGLMGAYYLVSRKRVATDKDFFVLAFVVVAWWTTLGLDFANNLGHAIGVATNLL